VAIALIAAMHRMRGANGESGVDREEKLRRSWSPGENFR
jgi:hypothetical protein